MLIDFTLKNFKSFKNEEILSAEAANRLRKHKESVENISGQNILKTVFIFGPNGSGKSNVLEGLKIMKEMVLHAPSIVTEGLPYYPFAFYTKFLPTTFKVNFTYHEKIYLYEFSYTNDEIVNESLKYKTKANRKMITYFKRKRNEYVIIPDKLKSISKQTKKNTLFLYKAQDANDEAATEVTQWFHDDLLFFEDFQNSITPNSLYKILKDDRYKNLLVDFLQASDVSVKDIDVQETKQDLPPEFIKLIREQFGDEGPFYRPNKKIVTIHTVYDDSGEPHGTKSLFLDQESDGTQKMFMIALSLIYSKIFGGSKTLLFDEFDRSLHFELSKTLCKIFNSDENFVQIISTTHEIKLLDEGLRQDQICLAEKDFQGVSSLKSIYDFKDTRNTARTDVHYAKKYINGLYGSYPYVDLDDLRDILKEIDTVSEERND